MRLLTTFHRKTLQTTEANIVSRFGWGLTKQIENHSIARFKRNIQRVRTHVSFEEALFLIIVLVA